MITHTRKPGRGDRAKFPDAIAIRHRITEDGERLKTVELPFGRPIEQHGLCPWCGFDIDEHLISIWAGVPNQSDQTEFDTHCPHCAGGIHATAVIPAFSLFRSE